MVFFPSDAMTLNGANNILNSCTFFDITCPTLKSLFRDLRVVYLTVIGKLLQSRRQ